MIGPRAVLPEEWHRWYGDPEPPPFPDLALYLRDRVARWSLVDLERAVQDELAAPTGRARFVEARPLAEAGAFSVTPSTAIPLTVHRLTTVELRERNRGGVLIALRYGRRWFILAWSGVSHLPSDVCGYLERAHAPR